jgi:hypothetical protein
MDTQTRPQGGFTSNLWLQFAALVIVVGVLIVLEIYLAVAFRLSH